MVIETIYSFDDDGNKIPIGTYSPTPVSLTVKGDWLHSQIISFPPDVTGLTFTCTLSNGATLNVDANLVSPLKWSGVIGTQTATFSYTLGGTTVTATKNANVITPVLNDYSWSEIRSIADAGLAAQYFSVGSYKEINITSCTIGGVSIPGGTYRAMIIGINHNSTYENANSIDFCISQKNTSDYEVTFANFSKGIAVSTSSSLSGGWTGSTMYTTYLPSLYNALSNNVGLQEAMIAPKKYTHNYTAGSSTYNKENYVTLSENSNYKLFLMSEYEIFGTRTNANSYEQNKQAQYYYYSSSGLSKSKIRYRVDDSQGSTRSWWTRSPSVTNSGTFCAVSNSGTVANYIATSTNSTGMTACFRI